MPNFPAPLKCDNSEIIWMCVEQKIKGPEVDLLNLLLPWSWMREELHVLVSPINLDSLVKERACRS